MLSMDRSAVNLVNRATAFHILGDYESALGDCAEAILLKP
jgi:hypothetical protein